MKRTILYVFSTMVLLVPVAAQRLSPFELPFSVDAYLFPEYQYETNPAILNDLRYELLKPDLYASATRTATTDTRMVDGPGTAGGTDVSSALYLNASASVTWLMPLDNGNTLSLYGWLGPQLSITRRRLVNYNTTTEDNTVESADGAYGLSGQAAYGTSTDSFDLGFGGSYLLYSDPVTEELDRRTDAGLNSSNKFIDDNATPSSTVVHVPMVSFGLTKDDGNDELGIGARARIQLSDYSKEYIAVDQDADGFDDAIVPYGDFYVNTSWGLGNAYYDRKDTYTSYSATLYPYMIRPLSGGNALILSGNYYLLNRRQDASYLRYGAGDLDVYKSTTDGSLTTGTVFAGIGRETDSGAELRYGARLSVAADRHFTVDLDTAGVSTFDPNNTRNLAEVNWGADPDNQDVRNAGDPTLSLDAAIHIVAGLLWPVNELITVYGDGSLSYGIDLERYQVFDTGSTGAVWTEWTIRHSIDLSADFDAGLYITLPNGAYITINGSIPFYLSPTTIADWTADGLPASPSGDSAGVTNDTFDSAGMNFGLSISYTVRR